MAQQDKTTFEGTFNNSSTGLFKTNTTKDIGSDDLRTLVENLTDSVPFNQDDRYTWSFPQVSTTGTNTYAATPSPVITAYSTGQAFKIKFTEASTGASTLNLNGVGAKKLFTDPATQATTGDIVDEQVYLLIYDAALDAAAGGFLMIGGSGGGGATAAEDVTFTPAGNISSTDVQAALEELDAEKVSPVGVHDLPISAVAMWPRVTSGCSVLTQYEMATSLFNLQGLEFSSSVQQFCQCQTALPRKWNNGTVTAIIYWKPLASGSGDVRWGVQMGAYSNDDALTVALGTEVAVTDTFIATDDLHITSATAAITVGGSPADADFLAIQINRDPTNGSDTLNVNAILLGITLRVTTDAASDA